MSKKTTHAQEQHEVVDLDAEETVQTVAERESKLSRLELGLPHRLIIAKALASCSLLAYLRRQVGLLAVTRGVAAIIQSPQATSSHLPICCCSPYSRGEEGTREGGGTKSKE